MLIIKYIMYNVIVINLHCNWPLQNIIQGGIIMNIGTLIKELRQKKRMSQESLAEKLDVSTQAVSRWETSVCYPDITLLPLIANVFDVTVDYLLGTDKFKNNKITEEIKETFKKYNKKGDNVGCYEYMKKKYEKYPNIDKIQLMYADACFSAYHENNEIIDEGIEILERLIKVSNNDDIKDKAYDKLFWLYLRKKDKVKLKDIFNNNIKPKLKKDYYSSYILEGEELTKYCQQEICSIIGDFWDQLVDMRKNDTYPLEEKVKALDKFNQVCQIMFENKDYPIQVLWYLQTVNRFIAIDYLKLDNIEKALYHIKTCSECAIESDKRPNVFKHTSLLFNHIEDNRDYISYSGNTKTYGNQSFTLWNDLQRGDFVKLKGNEEYINLLDELSKYKKQYN